DVVNAIHDMRATKPQVQQVLVKLNEGVSGEGNALVDLSGLPRPGDPGEKSAIRDGLHAMHFELETMTYEEYAAKLAQRGGVVEERIMGEEFLSPSVQLRVNPLGQLEVLSTHDQLLGGPSGQSYLGCLFPAAQDYAAMITREAVKVGERLAKEGVIGRFALDFVIVRSKGGAWEPYAIEINLRKGGTTHPFLTLQFLTDGTYDPDTATFTAPSGRHKYFVASDHVASPFYRAFTPDDLFDLVVRRGLHFDQSRQTGVVFHMISALGEVGKMGMVAVEESPQAARALYDRTLAILDEEAELAVQSAPLA
ncbi:MAG TPA: peptide ligase PGM1-related protein, partial [Anaerolineae bacterium]|nr:peptide ligase PGM1-related protein [Anaerolineae bacterium]